MAMENTGGIVVANVKPSLKWQSLSLLMRTAGRMSRGIETGYRYGFDSGEMLDYVYTNRAHGRCLVGRMIDRFYLNAIGWRGIRNRRELLRGLIIAEIERNRLAGRRTSVLDVASGPGRYLLDVLSRTGERGISVVCRDMDEAGLSQGRGLARLMGFRCVRYEKGDAFSAESLTSVQPRPNVVVVSGLYELFSDHEAVLRSLRAIYDIAEPGATILVTTQTSHPQLDMIANVLPNREGVPWIMECRPASLTEAWLRAVGFAVAASHGEKLGLFAVTVGRKPE